METRHSCCRPPLTGRLAVFQDLLTRHTLSLLPPLYQYRLVQLLPAADRCAWDASSVVRLSGSALSNEFFARACQEWRERLADGELTHESRLRLRAERERASRLDPWKVANFEDVWGHRLVVLLIGIGALPDWSRTPFGGILLIRVGCQIRCSNDGFM